MSLSPPVKDPALMGEKELAYRSISKAAICCTIFGFLGLSSFFSPVFAILPAIGIACGIAGIIGFAKYPDELIGRTANYLGLTLSVVGLIGGIAYHGYIYATEVPDGYQRISFSELKPSRKSTLKFSPKAIDFNKKKVFVKGYTRPGQKRSELKDFMLVGDFGACCFGGSPEITDVIAVSIQTDDRVDYSYSLRRIGGQFQLYEGQAKSDNIDKDVPAIYYQIYADYVKMSRFSTKLVSALLTLSLLIPGLAQGQEKKKKSSKPTTSDRKFSNTRVNDITFDDLVFEMKKGTKFKRSMLTKKIESLNKKKIRLRGFIRPSYKSKGLTKFIFVRDNKECCFGPGAALYDCVIVILDTGKKADYTVRPVTVEGEFYFKELKIENQTMAIYRLKNAVVKR